MYCSFILYAYLSSPTKPVGSVEYVPPWINLVTSSAATSPSKVPPLTSMVTLEISSLSFSSGFISAKDFSPLIVPPSIMTEIGFLVVCWATAMPTPLLVFPEPLLSDVYSPIAVITGLPETFSSPARISMPVAPVMFPPEMSSLPSCG